MTTPDLLAEPPKLLKTGGVDTCLFIGKKRARGIGFETNARDPELNSWVTILSTYPSMMTTPDRLQGQRRV